jgi:hypothetical protein
VSVGELDRGLQVAAGVATRQHLLAMRDPCAHHGGERDDRERRGGPDRQGLTRDQRGQPCSHGEQHQQRDARDQRFPDPCQGEEATRQGPEYEPDRGRHHDPGEQPARGRLTTRLGQVFGNGGVGVAADLAAAHGAKRYRP